MLAAVGALADDLGSVGAPITPTTDPGKVPVARGVLLAGGTHATRQEQC
jgi:hypothetical protein